MPKGHPPVSDDEIRRRQQAADDLLANRGAPDDGDESIDTKRASNARRPKSIGDIDTAAVFAKFNRPTDRRLGDGKDAD